MSHMNKHIPPTYNLDAFNCPFCGAFTEHEWFDIVGISRSKLDHAGKFQIFRFDNYAIEVCRLCKESTIWKDFKMIYPVYGSVPPPNLDMPKNIKIDYEEAKNIVNLSPRGATALLRLSIQKLCKHLGEPGKNINADIASLVAKGLPVSIQKALDSVRVLGNNSVHPGQIDLKDDIETAYKLFGFVNMICDVMITQPQNIDEFYNLKVPDNLKTEIQKRDNTKK